MVEGTDGALLDYFLALERLKSGKPQIVSVGAKINNDNVSLEAGRKKGSIKRSRAQFARLIQEIEEAAAEQTKILNKPKNDKKEQRGRLNKALAERDAAISREISLLHEIFFLKKTIKNLTGANIFPLNPGRKIDPT